MEQQINYVVLLEKENAIINSNRQCEFKKHNIGSLNTILYSANLVYNSFDKRKKCSEIASLFTKRLSYRCSILIYQFIKIVYSMIIKYEILKICQPQ